MARVKSLKQDCCMCLEVQAWYKSARDSSKNSVKIAKICFCCLCVFGPHVPGKPKIIYDVVVWYFCSPFPPTSTLSIILCQNLFPPNNGEPPRRRIDSSQRFYPSRSVRSLVLRKVTTKAGAGTRTVLVPYYNEVVFVVLAFRSRLANQN